MDRQFNKTYPARITAKWLTDRQLPFAEDQPESSSGTPDLGNYVSALTLDLSAGKKEVLMGIQTHPTITGDVLTLNLVDF